MEGAENGLGPDPDRPAGDPRADGDGGFAAPADAGTAVAGRRRGSGAAGDLAEEDSGFPRTDAADAGTAARGASVGEAAGGARRPGDSGAGDLAGQDGGFAPGAVADSRVGGPDRSAGEPSAAGAGVDPAEGDGELGAEPGRADADSDDAAEGGTRKGAVSRAGVLIGLLLALLGFALAVQVRSNTSTSGLPSARQEDLVRILDELSSREERLRRQISSLEAAKARLSTTGDRSQVALAEARIRSTALGILAGTIPAQGPGIQLTLVDPDGKITAEDLLDAVEELRAAGAEAIQVGGVRIGLSSSFTTSDAGLAVDGQRVDAPYTILAIGDPPTLATAMQIPGGVADSARRAGGEARVVQQQQLVIRALRTLRPPQYSRPADGGR
ncbi:MAG TPA: DUF881 domain-containing protein [Mycobacteriales bacterium]